MRPAIERIWAGVALPVRSALPATLASCLVGGFSGVVFLAIEAGSISLTKGGCFPLIPPVAGPIPVQEGAGEKSKRDDDTAQHNDCFGRHETFLHWRLCRMNRFRQIDFDLGQASATEV